MRNSGPFFVICLSFTLRTKNSVCLLFDFSKGFLQVIVTWGFSLTDFPPTSGVVLVFSPASPPPTLSFPLTTEFLACKKKIRTNIPSEKKRHAGGRGPTCCVTHGVYSGKRLNTVSVRREERVWPLHTSSVYICQVTTLINYQLQTLGYQQLVDKKLVLSTVG